MIASETYGTGIKIFFQFLALGWILAIGDAGLAGAEEQLAAPDLEFCMKTPEFSAVNDVSLDFTVAPQVKAIWIKGPHWKGKETRLFAWYGIPQHAAGEKTPGIVLLHGSGGTAFSGWVEEWNRRGYAAIAIDQTGCYPTGPGWGKGCKRIRHKMGGPSESFRFTIENEDSDTFTAHTIAAAMLAHSFLRSLDGVDPERIGIIGVSMGGTNVCRVAKFDTRLKFAVSVYGCGFLFDGCTFKDMKISDAAKRKYTERHDPAHYLKGVTTPMLFVKGTDDFAFFNDAWDATVKIPAGLAVRSLRYRMRHSHVDSDVPEVAFFIASIVKNSRRLAAVDEVGVDASKNLAYMRFKSNGNRIDYAYFLYTSEPGDKKNQKWIQLSAKMNTRTGRLEVPLPEDCRKFYFNLLDENKSNVSSEIISVQNKKGTK